MLLPPSPTSTSPPPYSAVDPQRSYRVARNGQRGTSHGNPRTGSSRDQPSRHDHQHTRQHPTPNNNTVHVTLINQNTPLLYRQRSAPTTPERVPTRGWIYTLVTFLAGAITYYLFQRYSSTQTTWINITASPNCTSIGTRAYTAHLADMPEGSHPNKFCSDIPITIHGRTIPHPNSCHSELSQCQVYKGGQLQNVACTITRGEWLVDFDEGSCIPTWDPVSIGSDIRLNPKPDDKCLSYKKRGYTAFMSASRVPPGIDHLQACLKTPASIRFRQVLPEECHLEQTPTGEAVYRARFVVEEPSCTPRWVDVQREWRCERYSLKKFSGLMEEVKDLDGLEVCKQVPYDFGMRVKTPDWCERERSGKIRGYWLNDFNVPECHPVFRDVRDYGCIETHTKRVEARVDDIGKQEDWYRMCTTTPMWLNGVAYYPIQCEYRKKMWNHWIVAVFSVQDYTCR